MDQFAAFVSAFVYIFVIIDPFASLPLFLILTGKMNKEEVGHSAKDAILIAGALAVIFLVAGTPLLSLMRIDISSFKIAGGIVLGLLGIETVLGLELAHNGKRAKTALTTLIATPLLTGPGLMSTLIIMAGEQGILIPLAATLVALFLSWAVLVNADGIRRKLGAQAILVLAKVLGLFLLAIGISFITAGLGM